MRTADDTFDRFACRAGRALAGLSRGELAHLAGVAELTIADFERGRRRPYPRNRAAIRDALKMRGIDFIPGGARLGTTATSDSAPESTLQQMPAGAGATQPPSLGRIITLLRAHRDELKGQGVQRLHVFGSVARGEEHPGSDIDLLADLAPGSSLVTLGSLQARLEELLGARVDIGVPEMLRDHVRKSAEPDMVEVLA